MSTSNFTLNQKIENLQYQINNLIPPSGGFVPINLDTTINDIKTFTSLPKCTDIPTLNDQLVNKLYVDTVSSTPALSGVLFAGNNAGGLSITNLNDLGVSTINGSAYPPVVPADTLQQVLDAGNSAIQTITLTDGGEVTSVLQNNRLDISATDPLNTTGTFNAGMSGVAGVNCGMSVSTSTAFTAPFPPTTASASLNTTPTTASIGLFQSAPFAPTQLMSLDLNNLSHTNTDNTTPFNISSTNAITMNAENIDLSTTGRLILPSLTSSNYMDYNDGSLKIINGSAGGSGNVLLLLQNNSNIAGPTTFETYKNDLPTSTGGDNVASWSATCNTNIGKTEISRINHIALGIGSSNNDGAIAFACKVNSTISNFLICNGGLDSGQIQVFKPISNPTGNIDISANASSGVGDVSIIAKNNANITANAGDIDLISNGAGKSINLTAVSSIALTANGDNLVLRGGTIAQLEATGLGADVVLKPETSGGDLVFEGTNIQSSSSGSNSGEHLRIKLNGIYYKIRLENDV
jgi:hypothetical protein